MLFLGSPSRPIQDGFEPQTKYPMSNIVENQSNKVEKKKEKMIQIDKKVEKQRFNRQRVNPHMKLMSAVKDVGNTGRREVKNKTGNTKLNMESP